MIISSTTAGLEIYEVSKNVNFNKPTKKVSSG
jgi:hypothetical protein